MERSVAAGSGFVVGSEAELVDSVDQAGGMLDKLVVVDLYFVVVLAAVE